MTYAVKKQMVKMALMAGEYLIIECAVPAIGKQLSENIIPKLGEEFADRIDNSNKGKKVVKFEKRHAG